MLSILCAAATLALAGCASAPEPPVAATAPSAADATDATPAPSVDAAPVVDDAGAAGPVEAYLDWLAASREPDAPRACSLMTEALQARMLAELSTGLGTDFSDCEAMITATAAMYAATGASADVEVDVVSQSAAEATLFATYVESGKCGTIHLASIGAGWLITAQSEECAR